MTKKVLWAVCAVIFLVFAGINFYSAFNTFQNIYPNTPSKLNYSAPNIDQRQNEILENQNLVIDSFATTIISLNDEINRFNSSWKNASIISGCGFLVAFLTCILGYKES